MISFPLSSSFQTPFSPSSSSTLNAMAPPLDDQTNHAAAIAPEVELAPSVAPDLHKVPSLAHTTPAPVSEPEQVKSAVAPTPKKKRVAIVGGGTAGLGNLISLLSLPESVRQGWQIDLFEQREDVGGIWCASLLPAISPLSSSRL